MNELTKGLRRELASEKESAAVVAEQLSLMTRRSDSVKGVLATTVGHYRAIVTEFSGETSAPPDPAVFPPKYFRYAYTRRAPKAWRNSLLPPAPRSPCSH